MKDIVVALGGGGSKGSAHIGVLRVLEREGFIIRAISGTSAGAIVASLYAYGYKPDEIQRLMSMTSQNGLFAREPNDGPSWKGLRGIHDLLKEALGDCCFEDLRLPCAVTAVDLDTAERLVFRPYAGLPPVELRGSFVYTHDPVWYRGFLYEEEQARGLGATERRRGRGVRRRGVH